MFSTLLSEIPALPALKTAIARLMRSTGRSLIAASQPQQKAMEGYKNHGLFTYVLLDGIRGKADKSFSG